MKGELTISSWGRSSTSRLCSCSMTGSKSSPSATFRRPCSTTAEGSLASSGTIATSEREGAQREERRTPLTALSPAHYRPPVLLHLPTSTLSISKQLCQDPEVDLVLVLAADEYHSDVTIAAANAKKHVLVEKPMCLLREEAEAIADAAKNNEVRLTFPRLLVKRR